MVRKLSLCAIGLIVTLVLAACSTTSGPSSSTAAGVLQSPTNQTT